MRAAVYTRISRDTAGEGAGVERQEADCRDLIAREGWELAGVYTDNSRSAYTGKARPAWTRLLADAADGLFDAVVAWHDDRLWRNVVEQQTVTAMLAEAGVTVVATPQRRYSTVSDDDGFLGGLQALMAQKESADKARRIRRKHAELAAKGLPGGGVRPFGYADDHVTIVEEEAALIRDAATRIVAGETVTRIVTEWLEQGVKTSLGNRWRVGSLRNLLRSPRYAGLREHRGEIVGPAVWDPILPVDLWERLQVTLNSRESTRPGPRRSYLLTGGIAVCGRCGTALVAQKRSNGTPSYACVTHTHIGGCGGIRIVAEPLEEFVRDLVFAALDGDGLRKAVAAAAGEDRRRAELVEQLRTAEARLQDLEVAHYVGGELSRAGYLAAREKLTDRIASLRRSLEDDSRLGVLTTLPDTPAALQAAWDASSVAWRRSLVAALIETVTVNPARGRRKFTPDRLEVTWRG